MGRSRRASPFPLVPAFFGLSQEYRKQMFIQIHDLCYHGKGGFSFFEVYNMPIWLRKFNIHRINEHLEKEQKAIEESRGQSNIGDNNPVFGPNIPSSNTYNFNK